MAATYTPIASITLGAAAASVTFSSIPQTYTDLVLVSTNATASSGYLFSVRVNGDSATNYSSTRLLGNGTTASSGRETNYSFGFAGSVYSSSDPIGNAIVNFMNYSNTTTNKTFLMRTNAANANTSLSVSLWRNTAAITSISVSPEFTANFVVGSTFNLYGILGANA
jgi:hypothetical protein